MRIYIASSWKNQHAVEMLTTLLREKHIVISWIENNFGEGHGPKGVNFEEWVNSLPADRSFLFDIKGAMSCDMLIYLGPAGKDAAAECGMAYAMGKKMIALWAKGEDFGLMRKMFSKWYDRVEDLIKDVNK